MTRLQRLSTLLPPARCFICPPRAAEAPRCPCPARAPSPTCSAPPAFPPLPADKLFQRPEELPSLACRRRYIDAMLAARDMKSSTSDVTKRMAEDDKVRLVRER